MRFYAAIGHMVKPWVSAYTRHRQPPVDNAVFFTYIRPEQAGFFLSARSCLYRFTDGPSQIQGLAIGFDIMHPDDTDARHNR